MLTWIVSDDTTGISQMQSETILDMIKNLCLTSDLTNEY